MKVKAPPVGGALAFWGCFSAVGVGAGLRGVAGGLAFCGCYWGFEGLEIYGSGSWELEELGDLRIRGLGWGN